MVMLHKNRPFTLNFFIFTKVQLEHCTLFRCYLKSLVGVFKYFLIRVRNLCFINIESVTVVEQGHFQQSFSIMTPQLL